MAVFKKCQLKSIGNQVEILKNYQRISTGNPVKIELKIQFEKSIWIWKFNKKLNWKFKWDTNENQMEVQLKSQ